MSEIPPSVIATGVGFILFVTLISWVLAMFARRLPDAIPRFLKIVVCGTVVQITLLVLGFMSFADESFDVWVLSRPTRAYFLVPGSLLLGCLAAWWALRPREQQVDPGVFD
jgi:hypothetical protein